MPDNVIKARGKELYFPHAAEFIAALDMALLFGEVVVVNFAKAATDTMEKVNKILKKHNIRAHLTIDSDPRLADYIVNGLVGVVAGGLVGGAVGYAAQLIDVATFPFGMIAGAGIGALAGGVAGVALTHWGLTVRFSAINPELIEMTLTPLPAAPEPVKG